MNLRPPVPTSDKPTQEDSSKQHRAALVPVAAGLAMVLGLAAYSWFHQAGEVRIIPYETGQMLATEKTTPYPEELETNDQAKLQQFAPQGGVDDMLLLREGDRTLMAEPLEIIPHPNAHRIAGFARTEGKVDEEFSYAKVTEASVQEVVAHYQEAYEQLGFAPLTHSPAAGARGETADRESARHVVTQLLIRQQPPLSTAGHEQALGQEVLIIRARPAADGGVLVSLWHRSTLPTFAQPLP